MSGRKSKELRKQVRAVAKVTYDYYLIQIINLPLKMKVRFVTLALFGRIGWIARKLGFSPDHIATRREMKRIERDKKALESSLAGRIHPESHQGEAANA